MEEEVWLMGEEAMLTVLPWHTLSQPVPSL